MAKQNILAKALEAPESMGGVEEICTGKTATLTQNDMIVDKFYACDENFENRSYNTFMNCNLNPEAIELTKESILYNCDSRIEMGDNALYEVVGNGTECGLINFLMYNNIAAQELIKKKAGRIIK